MRHPDLRPYLRSRTEFVLAKKREEEQLLRRMGQEGEADHLAEAITSLERELEELPSDEG